MSEWIPIEQYNEPLEELLILTKQGKVYSGESYACSLSAGKIMFEVLSPRGTHYIRGENITHYMPIPERPQTPENDMALTPAQRKAAQRKRDKDAGLVRADVSIHPSRLEELRAIEKRLQKPKRITKKP